MDNKLLVSLSAIVTQQAAATQRINKAINQLLNYSATYPTDGILYCSINMVLCAHSDIGFHNKSKGLSRANTHIFLSENVPMPNWNNPVLTLAQIINFFLSSTSKAELGVLFITAQEMVSTRNTLEEMRWPQPKSTIQTDNSYAAGVVNNKNFSRKIKTMDRRLHWMICREAQGRL